MPERDFNAERRFIKARLPKLVGSLPGRSRDIVGVFLHCTRGGRSAGDDGPGTENWANHPQNGGAFWDALIYESGQQVKSTHWEQDEQPLWCAGFGGPGTWSAQDFYIHIEIAQGTKDDPFPAVQIESLCQWVAELAREYGFPLVRIRFLDQTGKPPAGIADHENSANGRRLGKSDVGPQFPWATFLARTNELLEGDDEVTREEYEALMIRVSKLEAGQYQLGQQVFGAEAKADGRFTDAYAPTDMRNLHEVVAGHIANHGNVTGSAGLDGTYELRRVK